MISRNLYLNIIIRVIIITLISLGTAWFIVARMPLLFIVSGIITIIFLTANLIWYINSTNRKISYFFESVKNDDSTLSFPLHANDRKLKDIGESLNKINNQISRLRIESRQQEQYFQALIEHAATGLVTFNSSGFILHANSAAKKMLSADVLTHISQIERIDSKIYHIIKNIKASEQHLASLSSEKGTVQLAIKASSFKTGDEELTLISIQDIRNELDEKELDSWIRLIRVMMHEIINSIAPITSLSESLGRIYTENGNPVTPDKISSKTIETTIQGLNVIRNQGNGLLSFIESYRTLTRLPVPEKKIIRADDILSRIAVLYSSFECTCKASLSISSNPPDLEIMADETQVSLCLINIIKNAMQANEHNAEGKIQVAATIRNGRPEITVTDNGPGIPSELLEEIFVPFFTTRDEGSGIGLSLSKQIMRLHGGSLRVSSVQDKETVFTMSF